jgi:L-alanine-DL-glutamate epimerase-like enolase superfamily enzyme
VNLTIKDKKRKKEAAMRAVRPEGPPIDAVDISAYTIPTDRVESDGTFRWDRTTLVLVETTAGDRRGIGFTYANVATAQFIAESLREHVCGGDAFDIPGAWSAMVRSIRNLGRAGVASMAIAAVDVSLWDLKTKLLGVPLLKVLGSARDSIRVYGSGGFTSYSISQLQQQLGEWAAAGFRGVKMKIGSCAADDPARVRAARDAVGSDVELMVDANGAYRRKQAIALAEEFAPFGVTWFEEPVSSDDLEGLRLIRDLAPAGIEIAAGEYGYDLWYFRRMLEAQAVDVLQADATRCAGLTGFLQVAALCQSRSLSLSAHCGPSIHAQVCCSVIPARHLEYFHDHVRIEQMLFDGALVPIDGALHPDLSRPGIGLEFKRSDAEKYRVWGNSQN